MSICAHFAGALKKQRILLWFGLFAVRYGCALVLRFISINEWALRADIWPMVFGKLIGFAAVIPTLLLFQEFYGFEASDNLTAEQFYRQAGVLLPSLVSEVYRPRERRNSVNDRSEFAERVPNFTQHVF